MARDAAIQGRLRLWLCSERAMGLLTVPLKHGSAKQPEAAADSRPAPRTVPQAVVPAAARPPAAPQAARAAPPAADVALFAAPQDAPFESPVLPREERTRLLAEMKEKVQACVGCRLAETRTQTVFGEGDPEAAIFFIGEGPGEMEDQTGRPFVGRAGQKLDAMIAAMGLRREQVFIANVVKCRPPGNRAPAPDETDACTPFLEKQLEIVRPKVIVTLGLPATRYITRSNLSMTRLRGQWQRYRGIKVMPTYHPAYMLRNYTMETRKAVWSDLQKVMSELGLKPPRRGGDS